MARLPGPLRRQVEELLRDGIPYVKIIGFVRSKGHTLSKDALSAWFNRRTIVADEQRAFTECSNIAATATKLLAKNPDMVSILRELLAAELYRRRREVLELPVGELLFELRQLERLRPSKEPRRQATAAELKHHLEEIYGPGVVISEDVPDDE